MAAHIKPIAVHELEHHIFTCLDCRADFDTLAQATAELHLIARSLSSETAVSPFLLRLLSVDAAHKAVAHVHSLCLIAALTSTRRLADRDTPAQATATAALVTALPASDQPSSRTPMPPETCTRLLVGWKRNPGGRGRSSAAIGVFGFWS